MNKEELKKLFSEESFKERLHVVDSVEALQKFLAANNINISISDINSAIKSDEKLSEKDLKDISGGRVGSWVDIAWKCCIWKLKKDV